jgi:hypothetical protein
LTVDCDHGPSKDETAFIRPSHTSCDLFLVTVNGVDGHGQRSDSLAIEK